MSTTPPPPKKSLGQHFLHERAYIERIVQAVDLAPGERLVEIGPGQGAITLPLLRRHGALTVIEFDRDLVGPLAAMATGVGELSIVHRDVLQVDFSELAAGAPIRLVGNLPYNISSPILFHALEHAAAISDMTFMLQKEVVMRMVAEPGTEEYGRLSVMLQYRFRMGRLFDVPPGAFRPAPKVMSSIVRMAPLPADQLGARDEALLGRIVAAAFGQRRKTLRNTLREFIDETGLQALGIDPGLRGEKLSVEQYVAIANECAGREA